MKKNSQLKKNVLYNFIYQILILFLPFITAPYLARTIGPSGVGTYSFSQSIALYFTYITLLGLNNYGNRCIASVQDDKEKRSKIFCEIYLMQLIAFFISLIFYLVYIVFFAIEKKAALIMTFWVISAGFDINWLFFGLEQFKLTVIRNAVIKVFSVILIFIFIKSPNDIYKYIAIMSISTLISQIALWPYLKRYITIIKVKIRDIKKHFKPNLRLFIPVIAVSIYKIMDKIMLGYLCNMTEVGLYENAEKIITMVESLIVAIGTVMLPRMTAIISNDKENKLEGKMYLDIAMKVVIIYCVAAIFGLISIKDIFAKVYFGEGFEKTGILLGYLVITIIFFGCGNVLRTQYLIPKKLDKIFINSSIIGAIVNFIANSLLIPKYSSMGAAIGTITAEAFVCIYQFYKVKEKISLKRYIPTFLLSIILGLIMFGIIKIIPINGNEIVQLVSKVIIGALSYIGIFFFCIRFKKGKMINEI